MTNDRSPLAAELQRTGLRRLAPPEATLDCPCARFGLLAAQLLRVPAAFAVLADQERYVLVSSYGLPEALDVGHELTLAGPFCQAIVAAGVPLAITDWHDYAALAAAPEAAIPAITAYLGVPLTLADGRVVGVFALADQSARLWSSGDLELLQELARLLVEELALRSELQQSRLQSEDARTLLLTLLAHEFRTPLTSIKGFVELILDGEVGQVSDQQREFLAIVARNAERLIDLVNDRIASSRLEEAAAGGDAPAPNGSAHASARQ